MIEEELKPEEAEVVYVEDLEETKEETGGGRGRGRVEDEAPAEAIDDDLLARAKDAGLGQKEIGAGGGWRGDEHKKVYWLNLRQLVEFETNDQSIKSDKEFWAWFRGFRDDEGIGVKRSWASWKDEAGSWWDQHKPTNYLSKWWGDFGYSANSELAKKLAVALKAVQTTVSVVNTSGTRYQVSFADDQMDAPTSFTNFDERKVVVSPQPILDPGLVLDDAIEIETGYSLHEASHVQYTEPIKDALTEPEVLEPMTVAQRLLNIIEDARIEKLTGELFPGFAPYFDKMLDYLWKRTAKNIPTEWGPDLWAKLNAVLLSVRWPEEYETTAIQNDELYEHYQWSKDWNQRYLRGEMDARQAIVEMFLHLKADPETEKQMQEVADKEQEIKDGEGYGDPRELSEKEFEQMMKHLKDALDSGKDIETCPSPKQGQTGHIKLTPEQGQELRKLVNWDYETRDPVVTMKDLYGGGGGPTITWLKPEIDDNVRRAYKKPTDLVAKLKAAFVFRKAAPEFSDRLLKNGAVDDEELWRFGAGDYRIFEKKVTANAPETAVTLLVDMSGSMNGVRIESAYELANTMLECLLTIKGVRVRVRGHTTPHPEAAGGEAVIYRLWEQGDPVERLGLIDTLPHGWNYDGFAIDGVCGELLAERRPREDMVVIVLSDGKPNARGFDYSGGPAMDHVRQVVDHYKRQDITIIQIAIDPEMRTEHQQRMYEHWIPFERREELPNQLTKLLIKLFSHD